MSEELSREKLLTLLSEMSNLSVKARKKLSTGLEDAESNIHDEVLLTREELEKLIESQDDVNIYAFHSSGVKAIGEHSSG